MPVNNTELAAEILGICRENGSKIATAESCTGGMISAAFTDIPGSSDVFERGFVTYSNESKTEMLGVPLELIEREGAVSKKVAVSMAEGALFHSHADVVVAVTGIAGPGGGSKEKPVGLVYIAVKYAEKIIAKEYKFNGGREEIRDSSVRAALEQILNVVKGA